jgi:hypothetical protein
MEICDSPACESLLQASYGGVLPIAFAKVGISSMRAISFVEAFTRISLKQQHYVDELTLLNL